MDEMQVRNLKPQDCIQGFQVRPGFYEMNGATALL